MTKTIAELIAGLTAHQIGERIDAMDKAHKQLMNRLRALYRLQVESEADAVVADCKTKEPANGNTGT